ncbi:MAG: glycosyl hydrolase-related protein, partial [Candidatus Latescibacterota bacterium]
DLGLTLIKSGTHPDPRAEQGRHRFAYALLPHEGGFSAESVIRPAYEFNVPPLVHPVPTGTTPLPSLLTVSAANVVVESVKWAEDGDGFVVRLYEAERSGVQAEITFGPSVRQVRETNMLEEGGQVLPLRNDRVKTWFRPFEIKTLRVGVG